ncbi:MAG: anti-sigma factor [Chloroflexota bacterium]|nr:anti-sigma factor [Chloroflexota bacterium]
MNDRPAGDVARLTCDEVSELSGLYVLGALTAEESAAVRAHLDGCARPHDEFTELGGVAASMPDLFEPVDAPVDLKSRVMAAVAAEAANADVAATTDMAATAHAAATAVGTRPLPASLRTQADADARLWEPPPSERPARRTSILSWGMAATAVLLIAVLGAWNVVLQSRAGDLEQRAQMIAQAIAASTDPDAEVAILRGTGAAQGATGFAAFPADGDGYIVLVDLPPAPAGQTYQAWYLVDEQATSAGLMTVGADGYAVLSGVDALEDAQQIALTIEPAGGVQAPSAEPVVAGELSA